MTGKLLSKEDCAQCRLCCHFDSYGLLETPFITEDTKKRITDRFLPEQQYVGIDGKCLMKMEKVPEKDIYVCPLLDEGRGCDMGDEKPFDCKIFPFMLMELGDVRVIALSPACPKVQDKPLCEIQAAARDIAAQIFAYAEEEPSAVRRYISGYPIILTEDISK